MEGIQVGQEVAVIPWSNHGIRYQFGYTVKKVTPSGQIVVSWNINGEEREKRFDANGDEMGASSKWTRARLEPNAQKARDYMAEQTRRAKAVDAILAVRVSDCRSGYSKDGMQKLIVELEEKLAAAKSAVEAI